jgi:dephospho-CoA kinase
MPKVGKDLATKFFEENYSGVRVAFADEVKEIAIQMGWNKEKDENGRQLLIDIGCGGRKYNKDIWVEKAIPKINYNSINLKNSIVSDLRFVSEEEYIRKIYKNVFVIGIESKTLGDRMFENDKSQIEYNDIKKDFIIENNGTIEEFYKGLNKILNKIKELTDGKN